MSRVKGFNILILASLLLMLVASPVFAITNPDEITFGADSYYKVFYNVVEEDDWLIVAEGFVNYTTEPTDYSAEEAFLFELLNTSGNETLVSTTLQAYGDRPISIYLSASDVSGLGLTLETGYVLRITGNPLLFASSTNNTVSASLSAEDYVDQDLGDDGGIPSFNPLRNGMIAIATNMETTDSPATSYLTTVQGYSYLSTTGGNLFIEGIPGLYQMCPILFSSGSEPMGGDTPQSTGAYAKTLTISQQWGATVSNGLTMLGSYMGISQALAGSVVLFALGIAFAVFLYQKTQSGISVLLAISAVPFLGAYLGLMSIALAFVFVIFVIVVMGYFFFSRGAL